MEIVKLQTTQMLAASARMYDENATGAGLSRGYYWDDEE